MSNSKDRTVYAGVNVKKDEEIMRLLLIPPAQDLIHLQEDVNVKQVEFDLGPVQNGPRRADVSRWRNQ